MKKRGKRKTLNHLPIAAAFGHQLKVIEIIGKHCAADPYCKVTHGQSIFAMILSILSGRYALYNIASWLETVSIETLFGQVLAAEYSNDTRLAAALDAIYKAGLKEYLLLPSSFKPLFTIKS